MIQIKSKKVLCDHANYCQHRKVDKCQLEQERIISHAFQPKNTFVLTNHPISRSNQYKSSIPTLAYEKYLCNELPIDQEEMKGKGVRKIADYLNIIQITQQLMKPGNAYNLAEQETADYQLRKKLERQRIMKEKKRAHQQLTKRLQEKKNQEDAEKLDEKQFLERLVKKLNAVADHIILKGGQSSGARQRQLLEEKHYLNANYVAELKIKDRNAALGILEDLRVLLLKHKIKNEQRRQDIENQKKAEQTMNKSASAINSSMAVSDVGTIERELEKEEAFLDKFCNFQALQKKWLKENIQQVKDAIRRVLATRILAHAQREVVKTKKHKESLDKRAIKEMSPPYLKTIQQLEKKGKLKAPQQSNYERKFIQGTDLWTPGLNAIQLRVKSDYMRGNQGSSAGETLQRQLNYAKLFDAKAKECCVRFEMRETDAQLGECSCECHLLQRKGRKPVKCSNSYD